MEFKFYDAKEIAFYKMDINSLIKDTHKKITVREIYIKWRISSNWGMSIY